MIEFEINFRPNGNSARFVAEGWSDPEGFGRWLVGKSSRLVCPPPPFADGEFVLRTVIGPFLRAGVVDSQPIRILVNDTEIVSLELTKVEDLQCPIQRGVITADRDFEIVIEHPGAVSPESLDGSGDQRELAVSTWSLSLLGPDSPPPPAAAAKVASDSAPHFHLRQRGNLGNRMIQYMVALAVQAGAPGCVISGVELPEWAIASGNPAPAWADTLIDNDQFIDVPAVAARLASGAVRKISYRGYGQRMQNLLPAAAYRRSFIPPFDDVVGYDHRHLVINVRGGDVISGAFQDYVLIPPNFYREIVERLQLIPVFFGQLESNEYTKTLRAQFPQAEFVVSQGAMRDFETIRRSKNIVVSVSTFSWLAAWLSEAYRIVLPVNGLLNPNQFPDVDLLPIGDPRYEMWLFPLNHAVPVEQVATAHAAFDGQWRLMTTTEAEELRETARASPPPLTPPAA